MSIEFHGLDLLFLVTGLWAVLSLVGLLLLMIVLLPSLEVAIEIVSVIFGSDGDVGSEKYFVRWQRLHLGC